MENNIIIKDNSFQRMEHKEQEVIGACRHSVWKDLKRELHSNKVALVSLIMLAIIVIAVVVIIYCVCRSKSNKKSRNVEMNKRDNVIA